LKLYVCVSAVVGAYIASPDREAGRGLKHAAGDALAVHAQASPDREAGRGLKLAADDLQAVNLGIARP